METEEKWEIISTFNFTFNWNSNEGEKNSSKLRKTKNTQSYKVLKIYCFTEIKQNIDAVYG